VHGVDVEGKMMGLEEELVRLLGQECPIPVTYAGGSELMGDLDRVKAIGSGIFFFLACFWKVFIRERSSIFVMDVGLTCASDLSKHAMCMYADMYMHVRIHVHIHVHITCIYIYTSTGGGDRN
jgi:hypothetical protein